MDTAAIKSRTQASLLAGAVGDALGYTVEFDTLSQITARFGAKGITSLILSANGKAIVSDDTQMTLFTAEGLLDAGDNADIDSIIKAVTQAYLRWYTTQLNVTPPPNAQGLLSIPELWHRRAPGITCLTSLEAIADGQPVDNSSKGCGGVMRVAPVAAYGAAHGWNTDKVASIAGKLAFITHHHPLSTVAAATCAALIHTAILFGGVPDAAWYARSATDACLTAASCFPGASRANKTMADIINRTITGAANTSVTDRDLIASIGQGWVAEEALAIGLAAVLRHPDNIWNALVMAVNHDGDSDSTGAIAGNLAGAALGMDHFPDHLADTVELADLITEYSRHLTCQ